VRALQLARECALRQERRELCPEVPTLAKEGRRGCGTLIQFVSVLNVDAMLTAPRNPNTPDFSYADHGP